MASMFGSTPPPNWGSCFTASGQLEKRSTPTRRWHSPSAQTVSVSEGSRLATRRGGCGTVTTCPRSSVICTGPART